MARADARRLPTEQRCRSWVRTRLRRGFTRRPPTSMGGRSHRRARVGVFHAHVRPGCTATRGLRTSRPPVHGKRRIDAHTDVHRSVRQITPLEGQTRSGQVGLPDDGIDVVPGSLAGERIEQDLTISPHERRFPIACMGEGCSFVLGLFERRHRGFELDGVGARGFRTACRVDPGSSRRRGLEARKGSSLIQLMEVTPRSHQNVHRPGPCRTAFQDDRVQKEADFLSGEPSAEVHMVVGRHGARARPLSSPRSA